MIVLYLILFLAALVCFLLDAFGRAVSRINLTALGLSLVTLVWVLQAVQRL